jgi:hypothetical protein
MKYLILLTILFVSIFSANAQNVKTKKSIEPVMLSNDYLIKEAEVYSDRYNDYRYTYTYDNEARYTKELYEFYENDEWVELYDENIEYFENTRRIKNIDQFKKVDGEWMDYYRYRNSDNGIDDNYERIGEYFMNGEWVKSFRIYITLDENRYNKIYLYEKWNTSTGLLTKGERYTYTNDYDGKVLEEIYEIVEEGEYVLDTKATYVYDVNGYESEIIANAWIDNSWVPSYKVSYINDQAGNILVRTIEMWDVEEWIPMFRETSTYNENGDILTFLYDEYYNEWISLGLVEFEYAENGKLVSEVQKEFDGENWMEYFLETYSYDDNWNLVEHLSEEWGFGDWKGIRRTLFEYDGNNNVTMIKNEENVFDEWESLDLTTEVTDVYNNFTYNFANMIKINYEEFVSVNENNNDSFISLKCFPNPAAGSSNISYEILKPANVSIFLKDINGKTVSIIFENQMKEPGIHTLSFGTDFLNPGIYFVTVQTGLSSLTKKIVVLK